MEEYSDIKIDTSDTCDVARAPNATPATIWAPKHDQAQHIGNQA